MGGGGRLPYAAQRSEMEIICARIQVSTPTNITSSPGTRAPNKVGRPSLRKSRALKSEYGMYEHTGACTNKYCVVHW